MRRCDIWESYCWLLQLENLVAAKADESVLDEQRESLEAAVSASTLSFGSILDTKADSVQVQD